MVFTLMQTICCGSLRNGWSCFEEGSLECQGLQWRISGSQESSLLRIDNYLEGKVCELFVAPFDVVLTSSDGKENTVLQPDLCVVCDPEKLKDGKRCNGAPDWVVEIVSLSNAEKELRKKMEIYQEAQVSEYWVIRPEEKELDIYLLREGRYVPQLPLFAGDIVAPEKFPQLQIDLTTIF